MIETEKVNISQYIQIVDAGRVAGSSPHRLHRRKCSLQLLVAKSWQQRSRSGAAWPEPPLPLSLSWPLASLGIPWHQLPYAIIIYHMLSWSSSQLVRNFQFQLQSDRSIYWQLPERLCYVGLGEYDVPCCFVFHCDSRKPRRCSKGTT